MWQYVTYLGLAALAASLVIILMPGGQAWFRWIFGPVPPLVAVGAGAVVGLVALFFLMRRAGFSVFLGRRTLRGLAVSAGFSTAFGVAIVIADLLLRYPEDTNVPVPQALLFYPAVGFVAEVIFHLVPLAIVLGVLTPLSQRLGPERSIRSAIAVTVLAESVFQVVFAKEFLSWTTAWTALHVSAISLAQLHVFRRYDFVTMYGFRMIYYGYWHILWGVIRLEVMF